MHEESFCVNFMPMLCAFYAKRPLRNRTFFNMGLTPAPLSNNVRKTCKIGTARLPLESESKIISGDGCSIIHLIIIQGQDFEF